MDVKRCGLLKRDNLKRVKSIEHLVTKYSLPETSPASKPGLDGRGNKKGIKSLLKGLNIFKNRGKGVMPDVMVAPLNMQHKANILNSINKLNTPSKASNNCNNNKFNNNNNKANYKSKSNNKDENNYPLKSPHRNPFSNNFYKI